MMMNFAPHSEENYRKGSPDTLSTASRTPSDYLGVYHGYIKRPLPSAPPPSTAPYLLWDDNITPIRHSQAHWCSCCRICTALLVTIALIGLLAIVATTAYLGVLTSRLPEDVSNERSFDGSLKVIQGDTFEPSLANIESPEFKKKSQKYRNMIQELLQDSSLKEGYKRVDVYGFKSGSLVVFFRVNLDRRKVKIEQDKLVKAIHDVIVEDAAKQIPRIFKDLRITIDSISIREEGTTTDTNTVLTPRSKSLLKSIANNSIVTTTSTTESSTSESSTVNLNSDEENATTSQPTTKSPDVIYGPWTPLFQITQETTTPEIVTTTQVTETVTKLKATRVFSSGVASEIPFHGDDFDFHAMESAPVPSPLKSGGRSGEVTLETNVGTTALLIKSEVARGRPSPKPKEAKVAGEGLVVAEIQTASGTGGKENRQNVTNVSTYTRRQQILDFGVVQSGTVLLTSKTSVSSLPDSRGVFNSRGWFSSHRPSTEGLKTGSSGAVVADLNAQSVSINLRVHSKGGCLGVGDFRCSSGECVANLSRCNQLRDCADGSDEIGCSCADFLYSQFLPEKICDGVVDCWDYSDENNCAACSPKMFLCPNSNTCLDSLKVCNGNTDCPSGEDEKLCVRITPNVTMTGGDNYEDEGYLTVRREGHWGMMCMENLSRLERHSGVPLTVTDLARAVCRSLTYSDFGSVERKKLSSTAVSFYELHYIPVDESLSGLLRLQFVPSSCNSNDAVWITCRNLECGMRPMATSSAAAPRIVGGANAMAGSWPWQAAMYKNGDYMCGATLLSPRWLISAAHCFYNEVDNYWTARLGLLRRGSQSPHDQIVRISHIKLHPSYIKVGFINDVALLRAETPATYNDYVRPVCQPSPAVESVYSGRMCTVVGWGQLLETGHVFPDTLQEVELPIFTAQECRKKTIFLQSYQLTDDMFCAGYDRGGRDACLGDSGGPLVCQEDNGRWTLVGITSNGFGCARAWRPGIYTKVANYQKWMNEIMDNSEDDLPASRASCSGHRCPLGKCLSMDSLCNGVVECLDGSDEKICR